MKQTGIQTLVLFLLFGLVLYQFHAAYETDKQLQEARQAIALAEERSQSASDALAAADALTEENLELKREQQAASQMMSGVLKEHLASEKTAYLTFDDGPSPNTVTILNILKARGIQATFFVTGNDSDFASHVYRRIVDEGHAIGNHTYSHDYATIYASEEQFLADFIRLENLLLKVTGETPRLARFPGGTNNEVSIQYGGPQLMQALKLRIAERGYRFYDWNVDSLDASKYGSTKSQIIAAVMKQASGKQRINILFHDSGNKMTTAEALPAIIDELGEQGYHFRPLSAYSPDFSFPTK